jgi:hypothetical protein
VPSLARDCERRHLAPTSPQRGTQELCAPGADGTFECRWYTHRGGRPIAFRTEDEIVIYMARLGLPKPDELLTPLAS